MKANLSVHHMLLSETMAKERSTEGESWIERALVPVAYATNFSLLAMDKRCGTRLTHHANLHQQPPPRS